MEAILEKLNAMDDKLDSLLRWKAVHQEGHKIVDRDITEIRDTLFDNPGGLKSQVQTLMNGKRNISQWRNFWMGILQLTIVFAIIAVLGWFLFLYRKGGSELHQHQLETKIFNQKEN